MPGIVWRGSACTAVAEAVANPDAGPWARERRPGTLTASSTSGAASSSASAGRCIGASSCELVGGGGAGTTGSGAAIVLARRCEAGRRIIEPDGDVGGLDGGRPRSPPAVLETVCSFGLAAWWPSRAEFSHGSGTSPKISRMNRPSAIVDSGVRAAVAKPSIASSSSPALW